MTAKTTDAGVAVWRYHGGQSHGMQGGNILVAVSAG